MQRNCTWFLSYPPTPSDSSSVWQLPQTWPSSSSPDRHRCNNMLQLTARESSKKCKRILCIGSYGGQSDQLGILLSEAQPKGWRQILQRTMRQVFPSFRFLLAHFGCSMMSACFMCKRCIVNCEWFILRDKRRIKSDEWRCLICSQRSRVYTYLR